LIDNIVQSLGGPAIIKTAIERNLKWLERSFKINNYYGSSAYANVLGRWGKPYPETTGYLIPTLINCASILNDDYWRTLAIQQVYYFKSIQNKDGWFIEAHEKTPLVFDNAQILLGICEMYLKGADEASMVDFKKCYNNIIEALDEEGFFVSHNFTKNYNPSYYARIVWALLLAEKTFGLEPNKKTRTLYQRLAKLQNDNLSFKDAAFAPGEPVYTHTLVYTVRGLWESAYLLDDQPMIKQMEFTVDYLNSIIDNNSNTLAGFYDQQWNGNYRFICTVGNCQLVNLELLMYTRNGDSSRLIYVEHLLRPVLRSQRKYGPNAGAVPSSIPFFGPYQRFKYTNWTQKFYLDSLLFLARH
jgi:hypothetical protein